MADLEQILEGTPNTCYGKEEQPQDNLSHANYVITSKAFDHIGGGRTENAKDKIQHHVDKVTEIRKLLRFGANVRRLILFCGSWLRAALESEDFGPCCAFVTSWERIGLSTCDATDKKRRLEQALQEEP